MDNMNTSEAYDIVIKVRNHIYQYNYLLSSKNKLSDDIQSHISDFIFDTAKKTKEVCEYAVNENSILICERIMRYLPSEIEGLITSLRENEGKFTDKDKHNISFRNICAIRANIQMVREYLTSVRPKEVEKYSNVVSVDEEINQDADKPQNHKDEEEFTQKEEGVSNGNEVSKEDGVSNGNEEVKYTEGLLKLFHNHTELLEQLRGRSDYEIASMIKKWAGKKDKFGNPLIENPGNNLKKAFAEALKESEIISLSSDRFRRLL